jgi:D-glycero-alpha-D-manno-heptose-7-phosphate kinase
MPRVDHILEQAAIEASAPCRIDCGGTWDIKALALPLEEMVPTTINMALTLRTFVTLSPHEPGVVKISSRGFHKEETHPAAALPFSSPFGLFLGAISHFGFHGLTVDIESQSPVRSALGGSSTALVALIQALSKLAQRLGDPPLSKRDILHLAYHLEDGISGGNCGIQDQAAAVYGGVNQWIWKYSRPATPFKRTPLLDKAGRRAFSRRLLVAYSGKTHTSAVTNRNWIHAFLAGETRDGWVKANQIARQFAAAIKDQDWGRAARLLQEEMAVRRRITPEALDENTRKLVGAAESTHCGARFSGAGAGGSVWALGTRDRIDALRGIWQEMLGQMKGGKLLTCQVDAFGVL